MDLPTRQRGALNLAREESFRTVFYWRIMWSGLGWCEDSSHSAYVRFKRRGNTRRTPIRIGEGKEKGDEAVASKTSGERRGVFRGTVGLRLACLFGEVKRGRTNVAGVGRRERVGTW